MARMNNATENQDRPSVVGTAAPVTGMFVGIVAANRLARHFGEDRPLKAIRHAEKLRAQNASPDRIHQETSAMLEGTPYAGVHFGANGKPRFEITDNTATIKRSGVPVGRATDIPDLLDHPRVYDAVPGAQNLYVQKNLARASSYDGQTIGLGEHVFSATPKNGREVANVVGPNTVRGRVLHELQHHAQTAEGWQHGGSPDDFQHMKEPASREAAYRLLEGEQEAEMTRSREHMTAAQRRATPPKPEVPFARHITGELRSSQLLEPLVDMATEAWRQATVREITDGKPVRQRKIDPRKVSADPTAFQFKSGGDAHGVTDRLKGVLEWDPISAGKQIVYERANGELVIADGHQRRGLALRAIAAGQKDVRLDAFVMREKDGWTPADVRAIAALKNMKESSGDALDMAKVMRDRPDLVGKSLPMTDTKIQQATALAKLSPKAFDMVVGGAVKPETAAAVGAAVGDSSRHADMLTEMANAKVASAQHARLYVSQAMAAPSITEHQESLFGSETTTRSLLAERAKVLDKALAALKTDKRLFGLLEREAGNIEAAGNRLAHQSNIEKADTAGRMSVLVEKLSTMRGPVSDMLDRAARAVADGATPAKAARAFVGDVGKTMKAGGINALTGDAGTPMVAPRDTATGDIFGGGRKGWQDAARDASAEVRRGKSMMTDEAPKTPIEIGKTYVSRKRQPYTVEKVENGKVHVNMGDGRTRLAYDERQFREQIMAGGTVRADKPQQASFLPPATTKEQIAALAKAKAGKGRVGDPLTDGLFGDSHQQTDLVDMAKATGKKATVKRSEIPNWPRGLKSNGWDKTSTPLMSVTDAKSHLRQKTGDLAKARAEAKATADRHAADIARMEAAIASGDKASDVWPHKGGDPWKGGKGRPVGIDEARQALADRKRLAARDISAAKANADNLSQHVEAVKSALAAHDASSTKTTSGLRGTQNAANLAAINANRKASAAPKPTSADKANAELAARKQNVRSGTKVSGETTMAALNVPRAKARASDDQLAERRRKDGVRRTKKAIADMKATVAPADGSGGRPFTPAELRGQKAAKKRAENASGRQEALRQASAMAGRNVTNVKEAYAVINASPAEPSIPSYAQLEERHLSRRAHMDDTGTFNAEAERANFRDNVFPKMQERLAAQGITVPGAPATTAPTGKPSKAAKALGILAPAAVGIAMLAASNKAKAEGRSSNETVKEVAAAGAESAATMAAFTIAQGGTTALLMRAGMGLAKASIVGQAAFAAGGAVMGGVEAARAGGGVVGTIKGAAKGAWDMTLPGAVVNTAIAGAQAIKERAALGSGPQRSAGAKMAEFSKANAAYVADHVHAMNTPSERKPGWGPEAQIAAAVSRGVTNLPYGGDPTKAPGYVPPKKSKAA